MNVYSYVVARDYGFAPNPYFQFCTLATCKPDVRNQAQVDDIIVGTGAAKYNGSGKLVYVMKVTEVLSFNEYWEDVRFQCKKPLLTSFKQAYGDNIYHKSPIDGSWIQENSHHSYEDGSINYENLNRDTKADKVLVSQDFIYWGAEGPNISSLFTDDECRELKAVRGFKKNFSHELKDSVKCWFDAVGERGVLGKPTMYAYTG